MNSFTVGHENVARSYNGVEYVDEVTVESNFSSDVSPIVLNVSESVFVSSFDREPRILESAVIHLSVDEARKIADALNDLADDFVDSLPENTQLTNDE